MKWHNITVEIFHDRGKAGVRAFERLRATNHVDVEYCDSEEDAKELYKTVCRRVRGGCHVPVWYLPDHYEKHAELFY